MDNDKIKVDLPKKKLNKMIHKEFRRQYVELLKEQEEEIERLNNIIDDFEKYLFKQLQLYGGGIIQEYYDKLQELKDSDK